MVLAILFIIHCSLFICPAGAQTFTQHLQKQVAGEGHVTVHHDKTIDDLVNGPSLPAATVARKAASEKATPSPGKTKPKEPAKVEKGVADAGSKVDSLMAGTEVVTPDTLIPRRQVRTYKTMGYRVQAYAGGNSRLDRLKAEQTGSQLRALFPTEQVYTHFYSPRWICRIGNYRTYEEAHKMLDEVRKLGYGSATIVKGKISVPY